MDNDLSQVIDRTDLIENLLNQVIYNYTAPRKEAFEFFWNFLLDSSIITLGKKIKLANVIARNLEVKLESNSLNEVISLRNAFAHHRLDSHSTLVVKEKPEEDETKYILHKKFSWSGNIEKISRKEALEEFNSNYDIARNSLVALISVIKSKDK